jgi:hypothetical protein
VVAHYPAQGAAAAVTQSIADRLRKRRRADVVEDTAELAGYGLTGDAIADRLGMTWEGLCRAHRRAGVPVPVLENPDALRYTRHDRRS